MPVKMHWKCSRRDAFDRLIACCSIDQFIIALDDIFPNAIFDPNKGALFLFAFFLDSFDLPYGRSFAFAIYVVLLPWYSYSQEIM
jgi:hypothetical protein